MPALDLHFSDIGPRDAAPIVCLGTLGTDSRLWQPLAQALGDAHRVIRVDLRGHGGALVPDPPYPMGALVRDVEGTLDAVGARDAVVIGVGLGGMVAQALAIKRLDLVRGLVLIGSAAKIGTAARWARWGEAARAGGVAAIEEETVARWYGPRGSREGVETARAMLRDTAPAALAGCAAAIGGTDLLAATATLRLPTLVLAGGEDGLVPPDLAAETAALIPGAEIHVVRGAGHLVPLQSPEVTGAHVVHFLERIAHV